MTLERTGLLPVRSLIATACFLATGMLAGSAVAQSPSGDLAYDRSDLNFILKQIEYAEQHVENGSSCDALLKLLPNASVPWGLRTVDGRCNSLVPGQENNGRADEFFTTSGETVFPDAGGGTTYKSETDVVDNLSNPRVISHLIVNQSVDNPAAVIATADSEGEELGPDIAGSNQLFIPNAAPDEGLSAPINAYITFFGQFFDHGLDLIEKGGNGSVLIPVPEDDPLFDPTSPTMMLTRATQFNEDGKRQFLNRTTPHVDQQQTYGSHGAQQALLRHYTLVDGKPQNSGRLINGMPQGMMGTAMGMATWADVRNQARNVLGIQLDDQDVVIVPAFSATVEDMNYLRERQVTVVDTTCDDFASLISF